MEHSLRQSVEAFVEAASEKDALQELQVCWCLNLPGICAQIVFTVRCLRVCECSLSDMRSVAAASCF